jgi:hypothetical protein
MKPIKENYDENKKENYGSNKGNPIFISGAEDEFSSSRSLVSLIVEYLRVLCDNDPLIGRVWSKDIDKVKRMMR